MTTYIDFGGGLEDVAMDNHGNVLGGAVYTAWTAETGGSQITDLKTHTGVATSVVTSDASTTIDRGRIRFKAPNAYGGIWLKPGSGDRWLIIPTSALAQVGTAITNAATALASSEETAAELAVIGPKADAAEMRSIQALTVANAVAGGLTASVAGLSFPLYVPRRGGCALFPENSMDAWNGAMAMGTQALDVGVYLTVDGSLVCMQDTTVDRTTAISGNTADMVAAGIMMNKLDPATWFNPAWGSIAIPFFERFCRDYGNRTVLMPDAKNAGSGAAIVEQLIAHNLVESTILRSDQPDELVAARDAGVATMLVVADLSGAGDYSTWASLYDWICVPTSVAADVWITTAQDAGLKVAIYTGGNNDTQRRSVSDPYVSLGAEAVFTNDPWYTGRLLPVQLNDAFKNLTWRSGHMAEDTSAVATKGRGKWFGTNWGYDNQASGARPADSAFALKGGMSPIGGHDGPVPTDYTITIGISPKLVSTGTWWASCFLCFADDKIFDDGDSGVSYTGVNGYHILFRMTGGIDIYKVTDGVSTLLGSQTGTLTALTTSTNATYRITVSAASIKAERTDIVGATNTRTDTSYRGGYFGLGSWHSNSQFRSVVVA